ncbi:hypothetical protein PM082_009613 [Marasmius tenuissimus]|nr:hypothetical protein PM082_009613 [Marasmius tenuissimus]
MAFTLNSSGLAVTVIMIVVLVLLVAAFCWLSWRDSQKKKVKADDPETIILSSLSNRFKPTPPAPEAHTVGLEAHNTLQGLNANHDTTPPGVPIANIISPPQDPHLMIPPSHHPNSNTSQSPYSHAILEVEQRDTEPVNQSSPLPSRPSQDPDSDSDGQVNKAEIAAMHVEMRAMRARLAALETEAEDQPPDYMSSYTSTTRSR